MAIASWLNHLCMHVSCRFGMYNSNMQLYATICYMIAMKALFVELPSPRLEATVEKIHTSK